MIFIRFLRFFAIVMRVQGNSNPDDAANLLERQRKGQTLSIEERRSLFIYLTGTATALVLIIPVIITFFQFIQPFFHHETTSDLAFEEANKCISQNKVCPTSSCISKYFGDFSNDARTSILNSEASESDRILKCSGDNPKPTPKPDPEDTKDAARNLAWDKLTAYVNAAKTGTSPTADVAVQNQLEAATTSTVGPLTANEIEIADRAKTSLQRLAASRGRLEALLKAATAWRSQRTLSSVFANRVLTNLTPYDLQRLDESDYRSDLTTVQAARDLLSWSSRELSSSTMHRAPVYIYLGQAHEREGQIASRLKELLKSNKLNIVDDNTEAALLLTIEDASTFPDGSGGRTTFRLSAEWLNGGAIDIPTVNRFSTDTSGNGTLLENAELHSIESAVNDACGKLMNAFADHCHT